MRLFRFISIKSFFLAARRSNKNFKLGDKSNNLILQNEIIHLRK